MPDRTTIKCNLWWIYGLTVVAIMVFDIAADKVDGKIDPSTLIATCGPLVATVIGLAIWRPPNMLPWVLWLVGWVCLTIGNVLGYLDIPKDATTPSIRDVFFIAQFPYQALALVLFTWAREERRDIIRTLAATIIVVGVTSVTFGATLVALDTGGATGLFKTQQIAYIVVEAFFFVTAIRLFTSRGTRDVPFWCITVMALVIAASAFTENEMQGVYASGGAPDFDSASFILLRYVPTLAVYAIGGMVALHPAMRQLDAYARPKPFALLVWREAAVIAATFIPVLVTTYHGADPILRALGWFNVLLLAARFSLIVYGMTLTRRRLESGPHDRRLRPR